MTVATRIQLIVCAQQPCRLLKSLGLGIGLGTTIRVLEFESSNNCKDSSRECRESRYFEWLKYLTFATTNYFINDKYSFISFRRGSLKPWLMDIGHSASKAYRTRLRIWMETPFLSNIDLPTAKHYQIFMVKNYEFILDSICNWQTGNIFLAARNKIILDIVTGTMMLDARILDPKPNTRNRITQVRSSGWALAVSHHCVGLVLTAYSHWST